MMIVAEAVAFIRGHSVVMQSARVPGVATLVDALVGGPIRGSWWGHPEGKRAFRVLGEVHDSPDVLAMRLVRGSEAPDSHRETVPAERSEHLTRR